MLSLTKFDLDIIEFYLPIIEASPALETRFLYLAFSPWLLLLSSPSPKSFLERTHELKMTGQSALIGHTPLSHEDELIMKGLRIVAPSEINPNTSLPFGPPAPAGETYQQRSTSLMIGEVFGIFFVLLFAISRLLVRKFYKRAWGADDWMIIPGAVS